MTRTAPHREGGRGPEVASGRLHPLDSPTSHLSLTRGGPHCRTLPATSSEATHDHGVHARAAPVRRGRRRPRRSPPASFPGWRRSGTSSPRRTSATARTPTAPWPTTSPSSRAPRPTCSGSPWSAPGAGPSRSGTSRRRSRSRACPSPSCSRWCARRSGTARPGAGSGVNSTGFPFDSLMAVELNVDRTMNPLVNAGRDGHHEPGPGRHRGGEVGAGPGRPVALRRP